MLPRLATNIIRLPNGFPVFFILLDPFIQQGIFAILAKRKKCRPDDQRDLTRPVPETIPDNRRENQGEAPENGKPHHI